jgi:hypothetical protein
VNKEAFRNSKNGRCVKLVANAHLIPTVRICGCRLPIHSTACTCEQSHIWLTIVVLLSMRNVSFIWVTCIRWNHFSTYTEVVRNPVGGGRAIPYPLVWVTIKLQRLAVIRYPQLVIEPAVQWPISKSPFEQHMLHQLPACLRYVGRILIPVSYSWEFVIVSVDHVSIILWFSVLASSWKRGAICGQPSHY